MIDFEFRIITNTIQNIVNKKLVSEKVLLKKIDKNHISKKNLLRLNYQYFKNLKYISGLVYRGLPINNSKNFFESEREVIKEFEKLKFKYNKKLKGYRLIQFPNPNIISYKNYKKFILKEDFYGFEIIPEWHKNTILSESYDNFFYLAEKIKKPVAIETSFSHKQIDASHFHLSSIIKKFPNLKLIFPKFGAGIFLYPFLLKNLRYKPILISSAPKSMSWLNIFKINEFKKHIRLEFGTDHPLNGNTSYLIYKKWINSYEKKI